MKLLISNKISEKVSFQSDPEFPRSIKTRSREAHFLLVQSLFADYSKLGITEKTDRPVAILSLAEALAEALGTKVHYGIFECFLHRSLLWQPARNTPLTQIGYKTPPPSWSWMAYPGQIQYLPIKFTGVEWDNSVRLVKVKAKVKANDATTGPEDEGYVLEARVRGVMLDGKDNEVGQLYFDTQPGNVLPEVRCAIMGREETGVEDGNWKYYVLFVTECTTPWGRGKFRRVGMGSIEKRFILFDGQDDTAQIL
jgi:hypothetical protein